MRKYLYLFILIIAGNIAAKAQSIDIYHFMQSSPYQHYNLPSNNSIYDGYVSLPTSLIQINANLGPIRYKNLFETNNEGYPTTLTLNRFANSLAKTNSLFGGLNIELWGFGFRIKDKFFISLDHRLRLSADFQYSKDLFGLPIYGNMKYVDAPADIKIGASVNAYQEIGFSLRQFVNDKISWGIRPKVLFGIADIHTNKLSVLLNTNPETYAMAMSYEAMLHSSAIIPYSITFDKETGFDFDYSLDINPKNIFKNFGFGIDLGFTYCPIKQLALSAAVLDIGFINWKTNNFKMFSELNDAGSFYDNGSFVFSGFSQDDIQHFSDGDYFEKLLDSLAYYFPLTTSPADKYVTAIPTRLLLQTDFEFGKSNRLSAALQLRIANSKVHPAFTVAYDGCFFNTLDVCVMYTLQPKSYDNLGVALGVNLGYLNVYFGTQNIITAISYQNVSQITATFGATINWGHYKNYRNKYKSEQFKKPISSNISIN